MDISLSELIATSLDSEGLLPSDFSLPKDQDDKLARFADGALDGITIYHMGVTPLSDEEKVELGKLITLASDGKFKEAEEGFTEFTKPHRTITIIDDMQRFIIDSNNRLNHDNLYDFAVKLLMGSKNTECVKVALSILELYNVYEDEALAKTVRILGLCDEFTIFSMFIMRSFPESEKELLELAKRVKGWGRIHCVEFITTENAETKEWLLLNGVDNHVVPAYSAWVVYNKAEVEKVLKEENLSYEKIHALLKITDALMDEGPLHGISNMEDPKAYLDRVLSKVRDDLPLTEEDQKIIEAIKEWKEK
ncbi:MAG: hypothetical protein J5525_04265 [Lachnospiraceae bacterium]|nr:hypothetical protein [Lachnospiraceae bacterium]